MGLGDEIMALGEAEAILQATGGRVLIVDAQGAPRWSPAWENHPAIAASAAEPHRTRLVNGPGARPYIRAWAQADGRQMAVYSDWRARDHLGHLVLTHAEACLGYELEEKIGPYVVIEPHVKPEASPNKDWGAARFQDLVRRTPGVRYVQLGPEGTVALEGVQRVKTASFRAALGVLASARAYVGSEGGLHHAAAALGVPAAVIFGSFISPETTGYPSHANFYVQDHHAPCGRWARCEACQQALERIKPADVAAVVEVLAARAGRRPMIVEQRG